MLPGYLAHSLDGIERHELMLVEVELLCLKAREPELQRLAQNKLCAHRHVGDARSDQCFNAVYLFWTSRERSPEHHVVCPCIVAEQQSPGSLHEGAQRDFGRLGPQSQSMCGLPREAHRGLGLLQRTTCFAR